jgi:signal transduction histidine kinase
MLTAARGSALNADALEEIAGQTVHAMSVYLTLSETDGEELYTNVSYSFQTEMGEDGYISYQIVEEPDESNWLVISSTFSQSGYQLVLTTVEEVNELFIEARQLQERCQRVFLIATISGSALILVVSWLLTRPIKRLEEASRAFARGDYDLRLTTRSRDEIGDLTRTYNEMAQTIQEKIDQLEQAVRQREDFVANFAHELKTPMTSIIGYADTLYQKQLTPAQVHEASGYIVNEGLRLEALSFKLLELITLERQDFLLEEMDLKELLRDVEETAFPSALKRKVKLRVEAEEGYARVEYDLFKTLLLNLLDNAFKSGGTQVTLRGWAVGDRYLIDITDNGRGIPADQLQRITEAFYMVDTARVWALPCVRKLPPSTLPPCITTPWRARAPRWRWR